MSEIGFHITQTRHLSEVEMAALRRHYLVYPKAERDDGRNLRQDLNSIYTNIDELVSSGALLKLVSALNECKRVVVFATESSTLSLREFQQAMMAEDKQVRLVSEGSLDINGIRALSPDDLLLVVTTSGGFARRQLALIERSRAFKVLITASSDDALHQQFNDVLLLGNGSEEGSATHRIYATFGVTYFFDRLFAQYARAYDPLLS